MISYDCEHIQKNDAAGAKKRGRIRRAVAKEAGWGWGGGAWRVDGEQRWEGRRGSFGEG